MRRLVSLALVLTWLAAPLLVARRDGGDSCGTTRETHRERLFLHRQSVRGRAGMATAQASPSANSDAGDIALIEDTDGVVSRLNQFSLTGNTLAFTPAGANATHYQYSVAAQGYDSAAASAGAPLTGLGDDDSRQTTLPFPFPFFGATYNRAFVNSDGNLTFTFGDSASSDRSVGRLSGGPPRIAPLFDDLNPSQTTGGVRVLAESGRVVVSWVAVPEYSAGATGVPETFQVKLYPDGRIEFSYFSINTAIADAVVGIAPGNLAGATTLVDFRNDPSGDYSAAVAEWFASGQSIDVITVAQKFYQTHEDVYDYLMVYNTMGIPAAFEGTIAYEDTVRSSGTGYGVAPQDSGEEYGSASRLQAVVNMGPLSQYDSNPLGFVPGRPGDTPLSILAHESGHLFLAFASIQDAQNPANRPMLGYQGAHWSFLFDSEASFLEGEQIVDQGAGTPLEFVTGATVSHYSPLDQYLMGFRAAPDVPNVFVVTNPNPNYSPLLHPPATATSFDGVRQSIAVGDVAQAMGRRTPDYTVAQRRFRFAFILLVPQGAQPGAAQLTQLDTYRRQFEEYYATAAGNNAAAETSLKRSMKLSLFPAAGVLAGTVATATLALQTPPSAGMAVSLQAPNGHAALPASVTIPAGATSASFTVAGLTTGVEEVSATPPANMPYETAFGRVQVADVSMLKLAIVSGAPLAQPIVVRLTDANNLSYVGARIVATASAGGSVTPAAIATDARGQASFQWTPGPAAASQFTAALDGAPLIGVTAAAGSAAPAIAAVENAASGAPGLAAGSLAIVEGFNLAGGQTTAAQGSWPVNLGGVSATLNGNPLQLFYVSDTQIGLYVPPDATGGAGTIAVTTPSGAKTSATAQVAAVQPGIFPGAVLLAGTAVSAETTAVRAGDYIEIYCTGLGPTVAAGGLYLTVNTPTVLVGASRAQVIYSGLAPGFLGLYQVDAQVPPGLAPGLQPVTLMVNQLAGNTVNIAVQ